MTKVDLERVVHLAYQILTSATLRDSLLEPVVTAVPDENRQRAVVEERLEEMFSRDNCQFCGGAKGGVRGNENVLAGDIVACDYCSAIVYTIEGRTQYDTTR